MGTTFSCFTNCLDDEDDAIYYTGDPKDSIYKDLNSGKKHNYLAFKNS